MTYFHVCSTWRLLEAAWRRIFVFWKRFEGLWLGLKPCVASQTILRRLGCGSEACWRRLEGVLEASWKRFGGGLGLAGSLFLSLQRHIRSTSISYRFSAFLRTHFE